MLAIVAVVLAVSYAMPVRSWLYQRSQLAAVDAQRTVLLDDLAELQEERQRWRDPAFVRAQARERLNYVTPGEVGVVVLGLEPETTSLPVAGPGGLVTPEVQQDRPWWSTLWTGMEVAGSAEPGEASPGRPTSVPEESVGGLDSGLADEAAAPPGVGG